MQETLNSIFDEVRRSWRYRWHGLIVAIFAAAVGTVVVLLLPDVFTSHVEISVPVNGDGVIPVQVHDAEVGLLTDPNLNLMVERARVQGGLSESEMRRKADALVRSRLEVDGVDGNLFEISCRDSSGPSSRDLCALVLSAFESAVAKANADLQELSKQFVDEQNHLNAAEKKLQDYRLAHLDVLGQGGLADRLDAARSSMEKAQADYSAAANLRDRLKQIWQNKEPDADTLAAGLQPPNGDPVIDDLYTAYNNLQGLRSRFSDDHPDVIAVERDIERVIHQYPPQVSLCALNENSSLADEQTVANYSSPDLPIDQVTINLVAANIWLCRSRTGVRQAQSEINRLMVLNASAQPIESRLNQLTAERNTIGDLVNDMRKRLQRAGPDLTGGTYSVLTEPTLPVAANSPNRRLFLVAALGAAIVFGSLVAYFLGLMGNTFIRPAEVIRTFRLPFYGAVSQVTNVRTSLDRSAELISFSTALGALIAVMLILITVQPLNTAARHWVAGAADAIISGPSK